MLIEPTNRMKHSRQHQRPRTRRIWLAAVAGVLLVACPAWAQTESPVYVDDSPLAWEMFQRAQDQSRENVAEAVRLYQELLDQFGTKLIPVAAAERDRMYSTRARVIEALRGDNDLLKRYQLIALAEAKRLLEAGELRQLVETRSLTAPGLEALLRLGQRELESARFHSALRLLDEAAVHPNLDAQRQAHCTYMIALASHYLGDTARRDHVRELLVELARTGEPFLAELDRLVAQPAVSPIVKGISPFDLAPAMELDALVAQEIWSKDLPDTLARRRVLNLNNGNTSFNLDRRRQGSDVITVAATATPTAVFVNEGHSIRAFDRFTGFDLWPSPIREPDLAVTIQDPESDEPGDLNVIAVEGDSLVTLTGHADTDRRSSNGRIMCLSTRNGAKRWSTDLESLLPDEEFLGLFPYGEPIIAEGRVYCLARKQSQQMMLTGTYLLALNLQDGSLVWVRHIASSAVIPIRRTRPFSMPVYDNGEILVATSVGAVAAVDASTGHFNWLRVMRPPISEPPLGRHSWAIDGPVVTRRGVMAIDPDEHRVSLLDRNTGQMVESYPIGTLDGWGSPRYLLGDDRYIIAVGSSVRAFLLDDLTSPIWQIPLLTSAADGSDPAPRSDFELSGRVQMTKNVLILPTTRGLVVADIETGREQQRLPLNASVIPLAVDSQLFLASADELDAYMPLGAAERILRERLANAPNDIDPALSLLRLGIRVRQVELVLEAAEIARTMLARAQEQSARTPGMPGSGLGPTMPTIEAGREALFAMLLDAASLNLGGQGAQGDQLHAMLRAVAVTPEQQLEQLLAYGSWCEGVGTSDEPKKTQPRLSEAVEAYQTILDHALLAQTQREQDGVVKTARYWAIDRLNRMMETHGQTVYAPQEDYARMEFARLETGSDVNALRLLAARFPFAKAAGDAAIRAAQLLTESKLNREALAVLEDTLLRVPASRQPAAKRLLGEIVQLSETMGWREHAIDMLRYAQREIPGEELLLAEGSRTTNTWLETLGAKEKSPPAIGKQVGPAIALAGVLLPGQNAWITSGKDRLVLITDNDSLIALKAPNFEQLWTTKIGQAGWELLGVFEGAAILWQRSPMQNPHAVAVNLADGKTRWATPNLEQLERNATDQIRRERGNVDLMPNGLPLNLGEVLPILTESTLLLVRRTGEVYAVDLRLGEPIVTIAAQTLDEIHAVHETDRGLVLVGRSAPFGQHAVGAERVPAVLLVNHASKENVLRFEPAGSMGIVWSAITETGELVYGTESGVELVNLNTGERRWRQRDSAALGSRRGWVTGDDVLFEDSNGSLRSVALRTGALSEPFHRPRSTFGGDSSPLVDVVIDRGMIYAQFADRIVRVSVDGTVLGADVISDERDYRWLFPATDRLVLVSKVGTQQVMTTGSPVRRTEHFYRLYTLSESCAVVDEGLNLGTPDKGMVEPIRDVALMDRWLFISTGSTTLAVPMPTAIR